MQKDIYFVTSLDFFSFAIFSFGLWVFYVKRSKLNTEEYGDHLEKIFDISQMNLDSFNLNSLINLIIILKSGAFNWGFSQLYFNWS